MASVPLTGATVAARYQDYLQVPNGSGTGIDGTLRTVQSGAGVETPLLLSSAAVNVTPLTAFQLAGNATTAAGANMLKAADAAAQRTLLGVTATGADAAYFAVANNLSEGVAATMRTNLGLTAAATTATYGTGLVALAFCPTNDTTATGASFGIGTSALSGQTGANAAYNNTAIGYQVMQAGTLTTAAIKNVAVGFQAANGITSGASNTIIGHQAGTATIVLQTGSANVLIGASAHTSSSSSANAVGIGQNCVVAGNSVAVGQGATANGGSCVVIGLSANDGSGAGSVLIGASSGNASVGASSTAVGLSTLNSATGAGNTAIGNTAGKFISSGTNNVAIGFQSMLGITGTKLTGSGNVAVGKDSGLLLQGAAANNVILGTSVASVTLLTGAGNIYIGCSSAIDATTNSTSNELKIGNSSTPVISATGINGVPVVTIPGVAAAGKITSTVVLTPISSYISDTAGRLFPNFHSGAGGNAAPRDEGFGVQASLGADAVLELRFAVPPNLPAGTLKLRMLALANATAGVAKLTVSDATCTPASAPGAGGNPSAVSLTGETQTSITWTTSENDRYKEAKVTLTAAPAANDILVVAVTFNTTSWTLAQVSTWKFFIIWE